MNTLIPPSSSTDVCIDTPLRIMFDSAPTIGQNGRIQIHRAADDTVVDAIDLGDRATFTNTVGGRRLSYNPIVVTGNSVSILPHAHVLDYAETYYVTLEPTVFVDGQGASLFSLAGKTAWQFTTKASAPAAGADLVVAADGSGHFATVQGAVDFVPENNYKPIAINIRNGVYAEIIYVKPGKNRLTFRGEDRHATTIAYTNNEGMNTRSSNRAMMVVEGDEFTLENMTLINTTPKSGLQAEALKVDADLVILRNCDFFSYQDTLMLNGRVFVTECLVAGDVDFIWGFGTAYIEKSEIRAVLPGYNVQARNPNDKPGYVFVDCRLTKGPSINGHFLGRTGKDGDQVVYINCRMDDHIAPAGWDGANNGLGWWEYASTDLAGNPIDVSRRNSSRQLLEAQAAIFREVSYVLGGWNPSAIM
jgi:pectin methylesterase-like acyl-CoA thioesterase